VGADEPAEIDLGIPGITGATVVGRGGFGVVYRARQVTSGGGEVAVKVLSGHLDAGASQRFEREAAALGSLRGHPNICTVYFAGTDSEERPYLVMEYAPSSLAEHIAERGALPWSEVASLGIELTGALETAHRANLLHRDVKPENVLRTRFGRWQLADFGLARFNDDTLSRGLTTTVSHAAPELLEHGRASVATDVYALGSTLFVALTGRAAFAGDDDSHPVSVYRRIAEDPVPEMPGVPEAMAAVVRTAMAKDPDERFASAAAMGEALMTAQRSAGLDVTPLPLPPETAARAAEPVLGGEEPTVGTPTPPIPAEPTRAVERSGRRAPERDPVEPDDPPEPSARLGRWVLIGVVALLALLLVGGGLQLAGDGDGEDAGPSTNTSASSTSGSTATQEPTLEELRTATLSENWELLGWEASQCTGPVADGNCADESLFDPFTMSTTCTSNPQPPADCELVLDFVGLSSPMSHDGVGYVASFIEEFHFFGELSYEGCESDAPGFRHDFQLVPTSAQKRGDEWVATSIGGTYSVAVDDPNPSCASSYVVDFSMRSL
jgi:serine/threonine protein kinase